MKTVTQGVLSKKIQKGYECINDIEKKSSNAMENNEKLLLKLIKENKNTYFGKKYGFEYINSAKEYMTSVPLSEYEDYEEYIEEIIKGKENPISVREVNHFAKSSGSAGNPKKVPMCLAGTDMFADYTLNLCFASMDRDLGKSWKKSRGVSLASIQFENIGEITYGAISGKVREKYKEVEHYIYTSPLIATYPTEEMDIKYLHLRYALAEEDLSFMTCSFLNLAVDAMEYLEKNWQVIVKDIGTGIIDENIKIPPKIKEDLLSEINPMPERAKKLKVEFENGFEGILRRIWKEFKFIYGIGGGGFKVYADKMRKYLGDAKMHLSVYSASEGIFATHLFPESHDMVLILDGAFYEFIDINDEKKIPITLDKVKKDQDYELVITNLSGLYRYKIKDVIKVTGFLGTCPLVRFLYRKNQVIDMAGEKTNDDILNKAIFSFNQRVVFDLVEYSIYADYNYSPGRYIVFIEGENFKGEKDICKMARILDEEIGRANPSYRDKLKKKILSPLKLYFLRKNSFSIYRQLMVAQGGAVTQLKPVRVIDNPFRENFFFSMIEENPF